MPVVRCLELALTESTPDVIQKKKGEGSCRSGKKERTQKVAQRRDPTPQGDSCQAVSLVLFLLSFFLSIILFFIALSHPPINPLPISCNSTLRPLSHNFALLHSPLHPSLSLNMYIDSPLEGQIDRNA